MSGYFRAEETVESLRKEHTSRMTVERAKAVKLRMQLDNLEKAYKQKVNCVLHRARWSPLAGF